MEDSSSLVHVRKQFTSVVVDKGGSYYLTLPKNVNAALGYQPGDVLTMGVISMERPSPKGKKE